LVDLDDTLYDYLPAHRAGLAAVLPSVARELGTDEDEAERAWERGRDAVKARLAGTAAAHARLLYLAEVVHARGKAHALAHVRAWERAYWSAFLDAAKLRHGAVDLVRNFRARGGKVAIVTDLTLDIQIAKLERFGLLPHVDALAASEEAGRDKPAPELFRLALARLGLAADECAMVGDSPERDGQGARALGMPFFQAVSSEAPARGGRSLVEIAQGLGGDGAP
jgi:putative hydrolase of the HAD superfamily